MIDNINEEKGVAKSVVGTIISISADMTVATLIGNCLPTVKGWRKLMIKLGTFAIAMKVGDDVEKHFYKVCDEFMEAYKKRKEELIKGGKQCGDGELSGKS